MKKNTERHLSFTQLELYSYSNKSISSKIIKKSNIESLLQNFTLYEFSSIQFWILFMSINASELHFLISFYRIAVFESM